jgi:Tfp pilus assembly PilM family ATPase
MSRLIAFEWDSREARVVVGNARGAELSVEQAFSVPLGEEAAGDPAALIGQAVKERRIGKVPAMAALSRSQVELKPLTLPPAPDDELPEMVRLQAVREFTSLGEDWTLDYLPLGEEPLQPREVLAAAVSPEMLARMSKVFEAAGVEPVRVALRPMAAASLFLRSREGSQYAVRLLIDVLPTEADLTVLVDRRVVFTRTARLGGEVLAAVDAKPLVGEIRRTLAGVHSQLQHRRVEGVYLFGATPAHTTLASRIQEELNLPCRAVDPLVGVHLGRELKQSSPQGLERYAALVGLLLDEVQAVEPALDFLHPHKAPPPPSRKRTYLLAAAAAGFVLLLGGLLTYLGLRGLEKRIAQLREETSMHKHYEDTVKATDKSHLGPLEDWLASDYILLDEIAELAERMPKSDKVMLTHLSFISRENVGRVVRHAKTPQGKASTSKNGQEPVGGDIPLTGLVKDTSVISLWRNAHPALQVRVTAESAKHAPYGATFTGGLQLPPRNPDFRPAIKAATGEAGKTETQPAAVRPQEKS